MQFSCASLGWNSPVLHAVQVVLDASMKLPFPHAEQVSRPAVADM